MKARLAFCQQFEAGMPLHGIGNESRKNRRTTNLTLLGALPSIWMGQNEVDIALHRSPELWRMSVLNIRPRALVEISHKICKNIHRRLIPRESRYVIVVDMSTGQTLRTEMELPPV